MGGADGRLNECILGDCLKVMKTLPAEYIDLTVTSPPYDDLRDYDQPNFDFEETADELFRITRVGGVVVWVVGDRMKEHDHSGTSFEQALFFKKCGFKLFDIMLYQKSNAQLPVKKHYFNNFEYVFVLSKNVPKTTNLICDVKTNWLGAKKNKFWRDKDGILRKNKKPRIIPNYHMRGKIWKYHTGSGHSTSDQIAFEHPAIMPENLAADHIKSWSNAGDVVFDPFAGSGTTLKMARLLNRNYLGVEISAKYHDIIQRRMAKYDNQKLEAFT